MALECRGVGRENRRTSFHTLKEPRAFLADGAIAVAGVALLIGTAVLFH
jgi:hypothetical protein